MITSISKGYQLTIPAEMRKKLDLKKGSKVDLTFDVKHKKITIQPISTMTFDELFAIADKIKTPKRYATITPEELDKEIEDEMYG